MKAVPSSLQLFYDRFWFSRCTVGYSESDSEQQKGNDQSRGRATVSGANVIPKNKRTAIAIAARAVLPPHHMA
jgi:hypothetical protein